jgi:MoaA/NifB/PqqE/SkfB family radical SAM enzyme
MDKKASIRLSLHASNENLWSDITGLPPAGFRELIRKVKLLRNTGAKIIIHSVINKKNFADLPQLILLAHECKADEVSIGPVTIFNDHLNVLKLAKDEFERFKMSLLDAESMADKYRVDNNIKYYLNLEYSEKKSFSIGKTNSKLACYAGWLFAWINIDGDLRFCCNSNKLMGNITEKSFRNIWYGAEYNQERHNAFLRKNGSADCQECANYMANIKVGGIMSIYNRVFGRK